MFEQKDPEFLQKNLRKVFKLHFTSPRKQWERIDCFKKVHSGYWAKNGRICENFKCFSFKIERDDHQFLTKKTSTDLRICSRGVRVWSGRFQTFSENFRGDCENCILRSFSECFFSRQDYFRQNGFQNLRKNLQTIAILSAWLTKLHPICLEEQFEVIFLKKIQFNKFFWSVNEKLSEFCRKTLGKVVKFSSVGPEVQIESFFWKLLIWI